MYERGEHVTKNDKAAFYWWAKAADQGSPIGQDGLATMYKEGKGVPENDKTAVAWYRLSAEQGYKWAQHSLAEMYEDGEGVIADYLRSYMWFNLSASNGNGFADLRKKILAENMTAAQISKAQDMSSRCLESNYKDC
jgi:TPR repeat protein